MEHEEFKVLVSAYHDGEVTAGERTLVEAHLAECAECAGTLAAYGRMGRTLHRLPRGEPSRGLWPRVQSGLSSRRRSWVWRLLPVAPVLALLAVAITLVVTLGPQFGLAPAQPVAQREAAVEKGGAEPTTGGALASPMSAMAPEGATTEAQEEIGLTAAPPCPGGAAGLEVVNRADDETRGAPRLAGTLCDAAGQPLVGAVLIVSDGVSWRGVVTTTDGGAFALDLPASGTYAIALAGSPVALQYQAECDVWVTDTAVSGTVYALGPSTVSPTLSLEVGGTVSVTLRVR